MHDMTQKDLAVLLGESQQNLNKKLTKSDVDTAYLKRICIALNHDFFYDLSEQLRKDSPGIPSGMVEEDINNYELRKELKYVRIMEENLQLYRDITAYRDRLDHMKGNI